MLDLNLFPTSATADYSLRRHFDLRDCLEQFRRAIEQSGMGSPAIEPDGMLHRFDLPSDRKNDKTGWYVFHADGVPSGSWGSWREGEALKWSARHQFELTAEEQAEIQARMEAAKAAREEARRLEADEAALTSQAIWAESSEADPGHAYLQKKGVGAFGIRQSGDLLLIPMVDAQGRHRGLQRIGSDGVKRYVSGVAKQGLFHWIEGDRSSVYICEGYATGASIHMATGCAVVVAFDAGNLKPVAMAVKEHVAGGRIVLAADNDQFTRRQDGRPWNTGLDHAQRAAEQIGAVVVFPEFRDLSSRPTDFNDLHALEGLAEVRAQLAPVEAGPRLMDWPLDLFAGKPEPRRWLVKDTLPLSCPCLIAAAGGTGKGMLELELGLIVASGDTPPAMGGELWLGSEVTERGSAVLLLAEDSRDAVHERLEVLDPDGTRRAACDGRLTIVPLPNAGGPMMLVAQESYGKFGTTPAYDSVRRQLRRIRNLKLVVIDPMASFVGVDINKDPQAGQFVQGVLAALAEETGATVMVAHHMSKIGVKDGRIDADNARDAIRGTTALVDGVRLALAIWPAPDSTAKEARKVCGSIPSRSVFEAAVVKSNAPADTGIRTLLRGPDGLLRSITDKMRALEAKAPELKDVLAEAIAMAAEAGRPFTKMGNMGPFKRREELPKDLQNMGREKLETMVQDLLNEEKIVACTVGKSVAKWLDIPGGPFAIGVGEFAEGWAPSKGGRPKKEKPITNPSPA